MTIGERDFRWSLIEGSDETMEYIEGGRDWTE
jgi:hypothetical protein